MPMSASRPGCRDPTSCASPCASAGLMVSLARYCSTRALSLSVGPGFRTAASWNVRRTVSPARPMPCASEDVIGMIPFSCSRFSAAIVEARTRARTSSASPGRSGLSAWTAMIIAKCSATASRPNGSVVRRRREYRRHPGQLEHVGRVPAPAPLDVVRVEDPAAGHGQRVVHGQALVEPVGVHRHLHVVLVGDGEAGVQRPHPRLHRAGR